MRGCFNTSEFFRIKNIRIKPFCFLQFGLVEGIFYLFFPPNMFDIHTILGNNDHALMISNGKHILKQNPMMHYRMNITLC